MYLLKILDSLYRTQVTIDHNKIIQEYFNQMKVKLFMMISLMLFIPNNPTQAKHYTYESRKADGHVIHIVTLNPRFYTTAFVKAHNQVFGRETLEANANDGDISPLF